MYKKGFTLVEVLVAVAVMAILATIVVANVQEARKKARDTQRISDLEQVRLAIRIYKDVTSEYPVFNGGDEIGSGSGFDAKIDEYLGGVIRDPRDGDAEFEYIYDSNYTCNGGGHVVLYAKTVERDSNKNHNTVCGGTGSNSYIIILK